MQNNNVCASRKNVKKLCAKNSAGEKIKTGAIGAGGCKIRYAPRYLYFQLYFYYIFSRLPLSRRSLVPCSQCPQLLHQLLACYQRPIDHQMS